MSTLDDLQSLTTYGFRGEALASISQLSHVTITSRKADSSVAYRLNYEEGLPVGKDGFSNQPRAVAGNIGTQILVEDMFYSIPLRKKSMSPNEEYSKILDVVTRYSLHNFGIAISLKKFGENKSEVSTRINGTFRENARELYGSSLTKDLIQFSIDQKEDSSVPFYVDVAVSGPSYTPKRNTFILFINHRLVDCLPLKRLLEAQYTIILGKSQKCWLYINLLIDPRRIDVNMHPTKKEVTLQDESEILQIISERFVKELDKSNSERLFASNSSSVPITEVFQSSTMPRNAPQNHFTSPSKLVRATREEGSMNRYIAPNLVVESSIQQGEEADDEKINSKKRPRDSPSASSFLLKKASSVRIRQTDHLASTEMLLDQAKSIESQHLKSSFIQSHFTGMISSQLCLIQSNTSLYLIDIHEFSKELMYQECLQNIGEVSTIILSEPVPIQELLKLALLHPDARWDPIAETPETFIRNSMTLLRSKSELLLDLFGIKIGNDDCLYELPDLLENYVPTLDFLATFMLSLCTEIHWKNEQTTIEKISRYIGELYATPLDANWVHLEQIPMAPPELMWSVEHVIFPAIRNRFIWVKPLEKFCRLVTSTENLFKVFERC